MVAEVFLCSYERYIIGYYLRERKKDNAVDKFYEFELSFRIHSALSSLRNIATNGYFLACGSSDESIYVYDIKNRRERGPLRHHNATVSCIDFSKSRLLLSGAEDGSLCLWDCTDNLNLLKSFKQKRPLLSISVEPRMGKVALSLDSGGYLKVWDLELCKLAYCLSLNSKPHVVLWFNSHPKTSEKEMPENSLFVLLSKEFVDVRDCKEGESIASFQITECGDLTCVQFITADLLIVSTSNGDLILACLSTKKTIELKQAHKSRIKGLSVLNLSQSEQNVECFIVLSASSDGFLKAWKVEFGKKKTFDLELLCIVDVKCRVTDLTSLKN